MSINPEMMSGDAEAVVRAVTVEVMDWLRDRMAKGGAEAGAVQKEARQAGISDKALRRARENLGIKPRKRDFAGGWWWEINPAAQDTYTQNVGPLRAEGHLGAPSDAESDIEEPKVAVPKDKRVVRQGKKAGTAAKAERVPAELVIHPSVNAAMVIKEFSEVFGDPFNVPFNIGGVGSSPKGRHKQERLAWRRGDAVLPSARPASYLRCLGASGLVE
jgi:hypothetical protein